MIAIAAARLAVLRRLWGEGDPRRLTLVAALLVLVGGIFPLYLGIELTRGVRVAGPRSIDGVLREFGNQGFDLAAVARDGAGVPRVFLSTLPRDWRSLTHAAERKRAFTMVVLPLVLRANEALLAERRRVLDQAARIEAGKPLSAAARAWIETMTARYKIKTPGTPGTPGKALSALKRRVDVIPPSLAIAQAAIESGWGTSRFTTEGNALFGQWDEQGEDGMVPADRDAGRTYAIKRFESLQQSILEYMRNLNSHRAYRKFRAARAEMRKAARPIGGPALAGFLKAYSQQGAKYVRALNSIIESNGLADLDRAALRS